MNMEPTTPRAAVSAPRDIRGSVDTQRVHFWTDRLPCPEPEAASLLGGKGASLRLLSQAGFAVPPGFTVAIEVCRLYHAHGREWPAGLWQEVRAALNRLESVTGRTLGSTIRPLTLAIRSGAAVSMPGLMATILHCGLTEPLVRQIADDFTWEAFAEFLDSYVPVRLQSARPDAEIELGPDSRSARLRCEQWLAYLARSLGSPLPTDPELLVRDAIAAVFDSWENESVRRFRQLNDWQEADGTAVTIQAMFPAEVSGIVFSRYPERTTNDDLVVEAVPGLGRLLVGGQVTPSRWMVERNSLSSRELVDSDQLPASAHFRDFVRNGLQPLCRAAIRIESLFDRPVDVEFGYAAGELAFFQARPATTATTPISDRVRLDERTRLQSLAQQGRRLWVRHNLSDTLSAPTPLTWELWRTFMSGNGGYGRLYLRLGYRPSARVRRHGFLELIAGRIYADPDRLVEMFCTGYPLRFDPEALRKDPSVLNSVPTQLDFLQLDPWFLVRWPIVAGTLIRSGLRQRRLANRVAAEFDRDVQPRIRAWVNEQRNLDLGALTISELVAVFDYRRRCVMDEFLPETLLSGTVGAVAWAALQQKLLAILGEADGNALANELLGRIANPTLDRQTSLLRQFATGETTIEEFLQEFGHRAPNEMELSSRRWREMPEAAQDAARRLTLSRSSTLQRDDRTSCDHTSLDERLRDALKQAGAGCLHRDLSELLSQAATLLPYRETGKHELLRAYELLRDALTEISRRVGLADGIHFLTVAELHELAMERDFRSVIAARRQYYRECRSLCVPNVVDLARDLSDFGLPLSPTVRGRTVPATSLSRGQATGRVFRMSGDESSFEGASGAIVVATTIDAGCMPFLVEAAAIVVEQGGILSHVALLARQLAIPAVVADRITNIVAEGETIRVDADHGLIELSDRLP